MMVSFPSPKMVKTNGIDMAVTKPDRRTASLVLCHGFPELAYSWRHQIPALAAAGFRAIAPDQRGYGLTSRPGAIADYDMTHLTGDLAGMLDALGIKEAIFCGHDWGGLVVVADAALHPKRVRGVIGVNTPFLPRAPIDPIVAMRTMFGEDMYIVYFQKPGVADAALAKDVGKAFRFFMRKSGMKATEYAKLPAGTAQPRPRQGVGSRRSQLGRRWRAAAQRRGDEVLRRHLQEDRLHRRHQLVSQLHPQLGEERRHGAKGPCARPHGDGGGRRRPVVPRWPTGWRRMFPIWKRP